MPPRQIKMRAKESSQSDATELEEAVSQRKRPETGRYWLQIDRQTKSSFKTLEAAQAAGLAIKKNYPVVQVSVYDSVESTNTIVEAPAA